MCEDNWDQVCGDGHGVDEDSGDNDGDDEDRGDQVDLHAICSECVFVQQGFDCRLWFLKKKIPTMHKINKIKIKLLQKLQEHKLQDTLL